MLDGVVDLVVGHRPVVHHVLVDADHDLVPAVVQELVAVGGVRDLLLRIAPVDGAHHAAELVDRPDIRHRLRFHLVGERLEEVRAAERIDGEGCSRLLRDDLLRAEGDGDRLLGGQRQDLVVGIGVQGLRPAEHGGERLHRDSRHVVEGLLRGGRHAGGLCVSPQAHRLGLPRPEAIPHHGGPDAPRRPQLGDLLEEVVVDVEEEAQARREAVDVEAALDAGVDVAEAVGQGEGQLLHRRRARLADVIAGDRHGVEARHVAGAELDGVHHDAHRRLGWGDPLLLRDELLEHVVLHGAAELVPRHALLVGERQIHGERHRRRAVDRHRRGDAIERDVAEEHLEVRQSRNRHAFPAHFAAGAGVIGVVAHEGGHVERRRQPRLALLEQEFEARIRVFRPPEAGEHPHGPEPSAVHRRIRPARVRELTGIAELVLVAPARQVIRGVERPDGDAGERLERHRALGGLRDVRTVRLVEPLGVLPRRAVAHRPLPWITSLGITSSGITSPCRIMPRSLPRAAASR